MGGMLTADLPGLPGCSGVYGGIYSASWLSPRSTVSGAAGAVGGGCDGGWCPGRHPQPAPARRLESVRQALSIKTVFFNLHPVSEGL